MAQMLDRSIVEQIDGDSEQHQVSRAESLLGKAVMFCQAGLDTGRVNEIDESVPVEDLNLISCDRRVDDHLSRLARERLDEGRFAAAVLPGKHHAWAVVLINDEKLQEPRSIVLREFVEQRRQTLGEITNRRRGGMK